MSSSVDTTQKPPAAPARPRWTAEDEGPDPFGQTGVRQYFGKALAWCCIIGVFIAAAMWYRSSFFFDSAEWHGKDQALNIRSIHERLTIDFETYSGQNFGNQGWSYRGGYTRRVPDGWAESLWKLIGCEVRFEPLNPAATDGMWLRVKWQFIVICLIIIPVLRGILISVRRWREARE